MTSTTRTVYTARAVRDALKALLLGWALMIVVHAVLFKFSYSAAPTAATMSQDASDPAITSSFTAPMYLKGVDPSIYQYGEYQLEFYENPPPGREVNRYLVGFPIRGFEFKLHRGINPDGGEERQAVGAFWIQGKHIPLMPNGLDLVIPYGWSRNPALYILNTITWSVFAYVVLIVNTRMRLRIREERKRKKMKRLGRCVKCGYQVGELTTCPECGADQSQ